MIGRRIAAMLCGAGLAAMGVGWLTPHLQGDNLLCMIGAMIIFTLVGCINER